ncbi:MAG: HEAT repeat domain-containing protein [Candidatus Latescibacteria bacterium]|nr:HEAT repeat domain-containing protein [Candidatus Latescibacterota bacterium]
MPRTHHIAVWFCSIFCLSLGVVRPSWTQTLEELRAKTWETYSTALSQGKIPPELLALRTQLSDRNAAVRTQAVQSLSLIGGPMSALLLYWAMEDSLEGDRAIRIEAAKGLGDIGGRQALEVLGIGLTDRDASVRKRVVQALRWAGTVFAVPYIQEAVENDRAVDVRLEGVRMLRKIGTQFSIFPLQNALMGDRDMGVRLAAADALGEVGKKERDVAKYLGQALRQERNAGVKMEIVKSLGLVRDRTGVPYLQEAMQDRDLTIRLRATEVYGRVLGLQ